MKLASSRPWTRFLVVIVVGRAVAALAAEPPPGTYQETCTAAAVAGGTLTATCTGADGSEQPASLPSYTQCKGDIWNNGGVLGCSQGPVPAGPYATSCEYPTVVDKVLSATCTTGKGEKVAASLPDYETCLKGTIANIDGRLVCDAQGTPKGPYAKSCVAKSVGNKNLSALCQNKSGAYVSAVVRDYEDCIPNSIVNVNGKLVCDWTEYPPGGYTKSCYFKKTNGGMLTASCLTKSGELQPTSLTEYEDCGRINNVAGELTCGTK